MMRTVLFWAFLLGAFGGLIKDLRIFANYHFFGDSTDIYVGLVLSNAFNSLFATSIFITRGVAEKSLRLVASGVLFGVILGIITLLIGVWLAPTWPIYPFISTTLMGLFAGLIWGIGKASGAQKLYACIAGLIGGALGILIFYLVVGLTVLPQTILQFFGSAIESDLFFKISHNVGTIAIGAAQSLSIWYFIMRFHQGRGSGF